MAARHTGETTGRGRTGKGRAAACRARLRVAARCGALVGAAALVLSALPGTASAAGRHPSEPPPPAVPLPFGKLACAPRYGIRFCPGGLTGGQDLRVPSFDGVPLDADVALPATGTGPFPLVVLLHGLGDSKKEYESTSDDGGIDDVTLADHGYAVLMYTARGFGTSCGTVASRAATPACAKGWIRLADQRYEVRDTEQLAGMLVDEGLVEPDIAVAGVSYGAGQALELAVLKDRMRLPSGRLVPFTSPEHHVPMAVAAVYAMWPWDDLVTSLVPNGALSATTDTPARDDRVPVGVAKDSWDTLLYAVTASGDLAPPGRAPTSTLTTWEKALVKGEPYGAGGGVTARALADLQDDKSAIGIPLPKGGPAATAIQSGWTDTLFPVSEALHYQERVRAAGGRTAMLMLFDDVGHGWAQDKPADIADTDARGIAFLDAVMQSHRRPETGVVAIPTTCPKSAPSGPPATGRTLAALDHGTVVLRGDAAQTVTSSGGSPAVSSALNAAYADPLCHDVPAGPGTSSGTATYTRPAGPSGVHLLGAVTVHARLRVTGRYPELVGRLWDVGPGGSRQIVTLGVFRPSVHQAPGRRSAGTAEEQVTFQLNPADYTIAPGHTVQLQLVGSTAPLFRASNGTFSVAVSHLRATLPTA